MRTPLRLAPVLLALVALLSACGGGGGPTVNPTQTPGTTPPTGPTPTPTPPPPITGYQSYMYVNPNDRLQPQARLRIAAQLPAPYALPRRRFGSNSGLDYAPGIVEVAYARSQYVARADAFSRDLTRVGSLGARYDLRAIGQVLQLVNVTPGTEDEAIAQLKGLPGVEAATRDPYRYLESTTALFPNDPYFNGFAPDNVPPEYQQTAIPGVWDMHAIFAANAWGYAQLNTTGSIHAGANGGTVPIAIIDTGADLTHPELQGRVTYAESILAGVNDSKMADMNDDVGHGTDVAGIAGASANNNLGFVGVAYNSPLLIFKVFPNQPCPKNQEATDGECSALSSDIAAAIDDAVSHGAKVINLSLGDSEPDDSPGGEEAEVANAIASGVVIVAASGNNDATGVGTPTLFYPANDPGVLAVGASAIDDSNPADVGLKVASYTDYSTSESTPNGGTYLVAPGGDACPGTPSNEQCNDPDFLHWIENLYSSTALPDPGHTPGPGNTPTPCNPDYGSTGGTVDCRELFIGTSQAAPHVAGAAALLLSVGDTAANVPHHLCTSATVIPNFASKEGCGQLNVYHALATALGDSRYP